MKKTIPVLVLLVLLSLFFLPAQTANDPGLRPIIHNFSARNEQFVAGALTRAQIDLLVQAGLRAPSAGNRQPWLFTVVQDQALVSQILPAAIQGNVLIVISGALGDRRDAVILDCGLAAQNMFIAAQALGLAARQYTNPTVIGATNNMKAQLGIPTDHTAIIVTRFGRLQAEVDAVSSASVRASPDTKVIYR